MNAIILGDPGADSEGEGKSKRGGWGGGEYGTKKSKERQEEPLGTMSYQMLIGACLVPRPHYSARPKHFGSRGPCENVRPFPARSSRIRHRNELTDRD